MEEKYQEIINAYVSHFENEKREVLSDINEHIKYHFDDSPDSLYGIREYIDMKDSSFSQFTVMTKPQIVLNKIYDITYFEGELALNCYTSAQKVLENFKNEKNEIYSNLVKIVEDKLDKEKTEENS